MTTVAPTLPEVKPAVIRSWSAAGLEFTLVEGVPTSQHDSFPFTLHVSRMSTARILAVEGFDTVGEAESFAWHLSLPAPAPDDDEESDPETWGPEWDAYVWELIRPAEEVRITLVELVRFEAGRIRARGNAGADLMASALDELARVIAVVDASHPLDVESRLEVLERDFCDPSDMAESWEMTAGGRWA